MNGKSLRAEPPGEEAEIIPAYARLYEVQVPTLLVVGDLDLPSICENSEHAARTIPAARLQVMPGSAHFPQLEQPEVFNSLLEVFLAGVG